MGNNRKQTKKQKADVCICIIDSFCFTLESNTALQIDYSPMGKKRLRTKTRADDVHDVIKEQEGEYCDWKRERERKIKMGLESQMKTDSKPRARS